MQWPMSRGWRRRSQSLARTTCTKGFQEALQVARSKTKVPPISERVEVCKTYVERAKKRVQRAQEVMDKALAQRIVHEGRQRPRFPGQIPFLT